jgi:hypothetical protein
MKNNTVNKTIAVFLMSILVFGLIPSTGFAQPNPSPLGEVKGFNQSVFDSHFSKADREMDPGHWLAEARLGVTQAIYAWEIIAFGLYEDPLSFKDAKTQLEKWSSDELEARFSQWLINRFFGTAAVKTITELSAMLGETQKKFSWHLDEEGNIVFDDKTGDPLIIRPGEEDREFSQDLLNWRKEADEIVKSSGSSFEKTLLNLFPELLAYVPEELRENMSALIYETGVNVSKSIKREFENIAAREERIFTSRRTRDIWSLRKKSDDEAAKIFTERLISETDEACARGIEELNKKIEEASAGTGDLALMGEEWLRLYKEQFDRGLKAWEEAEERFFVRRIEWEQDSFKLFSEGEQTWLAAFNQFEQERQKWELKAKELFQSGEQMFKNISENFEKSIAEAKHEFELNMAMRIGAGTTKVKALIDMYLVCASAAISASENTQFWLNQYGSYINLQDSNFNNWFINERKEIWTQTEENYKNNADYNTQLKELDRLKKLTEEEITEKTDMNARRIAEENYRKYLEDFNKNHKTLFQIQDILAGKMTLVEELDFANNNKNIFSYYWRNVETFFELSKSYDLYLSYMEKALDARDRILANYAELIGTGALKDILADGASSEDFCLDEYQIALVRAKALVLYWERKTDIAEAVMKYAGDIDAGRMTDAEGISAWENAKAAYNESLVAYESELKKLNSLGEKIQDQQIVLDKISLKMQEAEEKLNKINGEYSALVAASIIDTKSFASQDFNRKFELLVEEYKYFQNSGKDAIYRTALEYGMKWGILEQREAAKKILDIMISGDGSEIPSLSKLANNVLNGNDSDINLRIRLAGIDLFADGYDNQLRTPDSTYSGADWYFKAKGIEPSDEKAAALFGTNLGAQLVEDYKNSSRSLLEKRLNFELESLFSYLNKGAKTGDFELALSEYFSDNTVTAGKVYETLLILKEKIELAQNYFTDNEEADEIIGFFLSGGSFFADSQKYYKAYYDEYIFCLSLLELYNNYAGISSFAQNESWQSACNSLELLFASYGLKNDDFFLPDAKSIYDSIFEKSGDFITNVSLFLLEFDNCFQLLPKWLDEEINSWKFSLIEYIAANALYADIQPSKNSQEITHELSKITAKYEALYQYSGSSKYLNDNEVEKINNAFAEARNEEIQLYYSYQITKTWEGFKNNEIAAENENHWRQFLKGDFITNYNPAIVASASLWKEGVLEDMLYNTVYFTNRLNDAFLLFSQNETNLSDESADLFGSLYIDEASRLIRRFNSLTVQYNEIARLGELQRISAKTREEAKVESEEKYKELKAQEKVFDTIRNEYLLEAEKFLNVGVMYDKQYSTLKNAHDDSEKKRFEYETQDAIQRWASTAYLDSGSIDLDNCNNKLAKAQMVLTVLSDIYNNESRRSYDSPEYNALYLEYEQGFKRKIKALEAWEYVSTSTAQEKMNNEAIFKSYQYSLYRLGGIDKDYSGYFLPESKDSWTSKNIIVVKDGKLAFSRDDSMTLAGTDAANAAALEYFFNTSSTPSGERYEISTYEESLRNLAQRMEGYFSDAGKFTQWGMARDYLLFSLIKANEELKFLENYYPGLGKLKAGGSLSEVVIDPGPTDGYKKLGELFSDSLLDVYYEDIFRIIWERLSAEEQADLEYYTILTLSGSENDYSAGFSQITELFFYDWAYSTAKEKYTYAKDQADKWWTLWVYSGMRDVNYLALNQIEPVLNDTKKAEQRWISGVKENFSSLQYYSSAYINSCDRIAALEGIKGDGQDIVWDDLKNALLAVNKFNAEDINNFKSYWEQMQAESQAKYQNVSDALGGLYFWARDAEIRSRQELEERWIYDEQKQKKDEYDYQKAEEAFVAGEIDIGTLKNTAEKAFGKNAAAWKNHFDNMYSVLLNDLSSYANMDVNFFYEFTALGEELTLLTEKTLEGRYKAELAAREAEWNQMRQDVSEKYLEWLDTASQIFENGRADWNEGIRKMEEAYKKWNVNFQNEYNRVSSEWAEAYLAGLEDKEKWLEQAAAAFDRASTESLLQLVGAEGERLSRFIDTREPFGIRDALPEAETLMAELLQSSGITHMANAFGSVNNIAATASVLVKRGMGGIAVWDAAFAKTAAADLARKTNAELADREARKLARNARIDAEMAINHLYANVSSANASFRESMDNNFIMNGLWRKSGKNYIKDVIKGSTLFTPVISETVIVTGYENYIMEPISLKTDIDENYLASLDSVVVGVLIENVFAEVKVITEDIFGRSDDKSIRKMKVEEERKILVDSLLALAGKDPWQWPEIEERNQSPGKFGAHIGYVPDTKQGKDMGKTKESIFYDEGAGEMGRLMTEFFYWQVINSTGNAELGMAFWDKRMWDDENTYFKAPTIRSTGQIVGAVAAAVVSVAATPFTGGASIAGAIGMAALIAGINSTNDLIFGTLDVAFGYKTVDEAAVQLGKTSLINIASSAISGVFSGIGAGNAIISQGLTKTATGAVSNAVGKVAIQTAMAGAQTALTTLTTSAINGITYSRDGGLGYSGDIFEAGVKGMLTSTLSSAASTFVSSGMQAINSGAIGEKLIGFSNLNKSDLSKLNNLAGSLAGQGVNYAMGEDFTLNLLNFGLFTSFTDGKLKDVNVGLLELHLGRDGSSMNFGTGGANVSFENLAAAFRGAQVWNVNNRISNLTENNAFDAIYTYALYDYEDIEQEDQSWDILNEGTEDVTDAGGSFFPEATTIAEKTLLDDDLNNTTIVATDKTELTSSLQEDSVSTVLPTTVDKSIAKEQANTLSEKKEDAKDESQIQSAKQGFWSRLLSIAKNTVSSALGSVKSLFVSSSKTLPSTYNDNGPFLTVPGGDSLDFFNSIMNEDVMWQYSLEKNKEYMCNKYVRDMILSKYGKEVYNMIFEGKDEDTNTMFNTFQNNPNLQKLDPFALGINGIQDMANDGTLILMIYQSTKQGQSGHIAFIGNSKLTLSTKYSKTEHYNGIKGTSLPKDHLIVVQAGHYPGITSIVYATNGWTTDRKNLLEKNLYFYAVKRSSP